MVALGTLIAGKYQLQRLLGEGGMGSVFEATHTMLGTKVAIKLLHQELLQRQGLIERFLQEAKVAAQIRSPHVVQMIDVGQEPGQPPYLVMELLAGEPLSAVLEREHRVNEARAIDFALQILSALEAAHALGVIHRDLKPENVFVTVSHGRPHLKLIDFGIAKLKSTDPGAKNLTVAGTVMGTAEYMAPEQAVRADQVDGRADLYSVGVMLYELLAGTRPIVSDDPRALFTLAARGPIRPLTELAGSSPALNELVMRTLAFRPDERFGNATELRIALEAVSRGAAVPVPAAGAELSAGTMMGAPVPQALALTGEMPRKPMRAGGTQMAPAVTSHGAAASPMTSLAPPATGMGGPGAPGGRPMTGMGPGAPMGGFAGGPPGYGHAPPGYPPPAMHGGPPPAGPPGGYGAYAPPMAPRPKPKGKGGLWIVLSLLLVGGLIGIVVFVVAMSSDDTSTPPIAQPAFPTTPATTTAATTTTATATAEPTVDPGLGQLTPAGPTSPSPSPSPSPQTKPTGTGKTQPTATASAQPSTAPPLLFPSGLTLPSTMPSLPPLPSTFQWPFPPP